MNEEARPPFPWGRSALAAASGLLVVLSALHQLHDARGRGDVERFFSTFTLDARRPELLGTARVEASADLAMQVAVRAATLDVAGRTALGALTPELRELWMRSVRELPEEVAAARELGLRAVAARPAWAFQPLALAELVLADEWRESAEERRPERWLAPVKLAAAWAPMLPAAFATWGAAALERWPLLPEEERREARAALKRALTDEGFQRIALGAVLHAFGPEDGLSLVPETPAALATARRALASTATFEEQAALEERWRAAERAERRRKAAEIAATLEAGRAAQAMTLAYAFLQAHPVEAFDDAEGRDEARTVLRAIGDGRPGPWRTDRRGQLVRWFLANPLRIGSGLDPARAARGLAGVPDGVRALLFLHADDDFGWRRVVSASDTAGASHWTPFYVELARRALADGDAAEAEAALSKVSRFDLGACDVLLVRREVARARQRTFELADLERAWPAAFPETLDVAAWPPAGAGSLPLCVDPALGDGARLVVTVRSTGPALAWWGWDGGREALVRIAGDGETELSFPLARLRGLRTFSMGPLVGAPVRPTGARIAAGDGGGAEGSPPPAG